MSFHCNSSNSRRRTDDTTTTTTKIIINNKTNHNDSRSDITTRNGSTTSSSSSRKKYRFLRVHLQILQTLYKGDNNSRDNDDSNKHKNNNLDNSHNDSDGKHSDGKDKTDGTVNKKDDGEKAGNDDDDAGREATTTTNNNEEEDEIELDWKIIHQFMTVRDQLGQMSNEVQWMDDLHQETKRLQTIVEQCSRRRSSNINYYESDVDDCDDDRAMTTHRNFIDHNNNDISHVLRLDPDDFFFNSIMIANQQQQNQYTNTTSRTITIPSVWNNNGYDPISPSPRRGMVQTPRSSNSTKKKRKYYEVASSSSLQSRDKKHVAVTGTTAGVVRTHGHNKRIDDRYDNNMSLSNRSNGSNSSNTTTTTITNYGTGMISMLWKRRCDSAYHKWMIQIRPYIKLTEQVLSHIQWLTQQLKIMVQEEEQRMTRSSRCFHEQHHNHLQQHHSHSTHYHNRKSNDSSNGAHNDRYKDDDEKNENDNDDITERIACVETKMDLWKRLHHDLVSCVRYRQKYHRKSKKPPQQEKRQQKRQRQRERRRVNIHH